MPSAPPSPPSPLSYVAIDLAAIERNLAIVNQRSGLGAYCVLKADAYGHGAVEVARRLAPLPGCVGIAVARAEEALEIRDRGGMVAASDKPLLCLGAFPAAFAEAERYELLSELGQRKITLVLNSLDDVQAVTEVPEDLRKRLGPIQVAFDTGMRREGLQTSSLEKAAVALAAAGVEVASVLTHLVESEADSDLGLSQRRDALDCFDRLAFRASPKVPKFHLANSAGALGVSGEPLADPDYDEAVRVGGALYGLDLRAEGSQPELEQAMSVRSRIVQTRTVEAGTTVGYNQRWRARRPSVLGLVPIGYADGLGGDPPHYLWFRRSGPSDLASKRVPVVGSVSMDLTVVDLTDGAEGILRDPEIAIGDEIVVLGHGSPDRHADPSERSIGNERVPARLHAASRNESLYSVTVGFGRRLPRLYEN